MVQRRFDPPPEAEQLPALHSKALDHLEFIRETMAQSSAFTAVPGVGGVFMGITALAAAYLAHIQPTEHDWFLVWGGEALLAIGVGVFAMMVKARAVNVKLFRGAARRFTMSLVPPIVAGALVTLVIYQNDLDFVLPGLWLLCYGAGIVTAGTFSIRIVPIMGICFMVMGAVALFCPSAYGDLFMAAGFGGLHIIFGSIIAWRYGG